MDLWYRCGGPTAETFFAPVHWLDRQIRPDYWTYTADADDLGVYRRVPMGSERR